MRIVGKFNTSDHGIFRNTKDTEDTGSISESGTIHRISSLQAPMWVWAWVWVHVSDTGDLFGY